VRLSPDHSRGIDLNVNATDYMGRHPIWPAPRT
jgi:hypothetical protein